MLTEILCVAHLAYSLLCCGQLWMRVRGCTAYSFARTCYNEIFMNHAVLVRLLTKPEGHSDQHWVRNPRNNTYMPLPAWLLTYAAYSLVATASCPGTLRDYLPLCHGRCGPQFLTQIGEKFP